ncbi:hypothetical protein N9104_01685 [Pseudomonadales bacterium]|nr:hypothetical protein [Pseudomonadales bacterium]
MSDIHGMPIARLCFINGILHQMVVEENGDTEWVIVPEIGND